MEFIGLKELVSDFSIHCFEKGFKSEGFNLRLNRLNNIAVINFQKSKDYIPNGYKFTINIGVHYSELFYFNACQSIKKPIISDCQWKIRVGFLLSFKRDYWWTIDEKSDIKALKSNLFEIFDSVINPTFEKLISDDGYINNSMANAVLGTSEIDRLKNLASFFCIRQDARLKEILKQLELYCNINKLNNLYEKKVAQINSWEQKPVNNKIWSFVDDSYKWL